MASILSAPRITPAAMDAGSVPGPGWAVLPRGLQDWISPMIRNPDHVTIAVADADVASAFFGLLGFEIGHVAQIDGGEPAAYMGNPAMKAAHLKANGVRALTEEMGYISRRLQFFEGPEQVTIELVEWVEVP